MFTIGHFSKVTGLTVKTLRFYHEKGLLPPAAIDRESGYRYYDQGSLERARVIIALRGFEFSLEEIAEILARSSDEEDILDHLEKQKLVIAEKISRQKDLAATIDRILSTEREARTARLRSDGFQPEIKKIDAQLLAGIRVCGEYSEAGRVFGTLGRRLGRHIVGKALCLYYDGEYRESDANFEPCMPVRKAVEVEGITMHELPGQHCVTLMHSGPYEELGRSYEKVFDFAQSNKVEIELPTREVYFKGPGMIFKGNPQKYLTEIQLPIG